MISSEAQAAELRARAHRRLVGAIAMVVVAVVVLPLVLNPEPDRMIGVIPIRLVELPQTAAPVPDSSPSASADSAQLPVDLEAADVPLPPPLSSAAQGFAPGQQAVPTPPSVALYPPSAPNLASPPPASEVQPLVPKPPHNRSDDGARAIALLEGRDPPPTPQSRPADKGNFVLQIASYSVRGDADSRREKLHAAGLTNAFVQVANVGSREQFRLRVGPFPSREAAQAAQARLRTLGYDNGFIAAQ
jgi:DedD protein